MGPSFPKSKLHYYKENKIHLNTILGVVEYPLDLILLSFSIRHGHLGEIQQ